MTSLDGDGDLTSMEAEGVEGVGLSLSKDWTTSAEGGGT